LLFAYLAVWFCLGIIFVLLSASNNLVHLDEGIHIIIDSRDVCAVPGCYDDRLLSEKGRWSLEK